MRSSGSFSTTFEPIKPLDPVTKIRSSVDAIYSEFIAELSGKRASELQGPRKPSQDQLVEYTFRRLAIHSFCFSSWRKPGGQGKPPLSAPITNDIGPLRRKKAKGLGNTGVIGRMRRTTSNSPAKMRRRNCLHAHHSKARANG